jgi:transposase-like protein
MPPEPIYVDTARIVALYRGGATCEQIARQFGVGTTTVWRRLVAAGVVRRLPNSARYPNVESGRRRVA